MKTINVGPRAMLSRIINFLQICLGGLQGKPWAHADPRYRARVRQTDPEGTCSHPWSGATLTDELFES